MKNSIIGLKRLDVNSNCYICIYENCFIWKLGESKKIKNLNTMVNSHKPKNIYNKKSIRFSQHHVKIGTKKFPKNKENHLTLI
jgi:hypothetical protein